MSEYIITPDGRKWIPKESSPVVDSDWFWILPDGLLPSYHEFYPIRESAPAPGVMLLGSIDSQQEGHVNVPHNEPWQYFAHDIMALKVYGVHYTELLKDDKSVIIKAYERVHANHLALCNGTGFPDREGDIVRVNYVAGTNIGAPKCEYDKDRRFVTDCIRGEVVTNSKNVKMIKTESFIWSEGPPNNYGVEILSDPRISYCTIIYSGGSVGSFPQLLGDVPVPYVTMNETYYPLDFTKRVSERIPLYYTAPLTVWLRSIMKNVSRFLIQN